ncbi:unnamed protein product, partial [Amoebophrya sp. A25]
QQYEDLEHCSLLRMRVTLAISSPQRLWCYIKETPWKLKSNKMGNQLSASCP